MVNIITLQVDPTMLLAIQQGLKALQLVAQQTSASIEEQVLAQLNDKKPESETVS